MDLKPEKPTDCWGTPPAFVRGLEGFYHRKFTVDAAASEGNAKCKRFITREQNGLDLNHYKDSDFIFCNPPYSPPNITRWVSGALDSPFCWVMLLPSSTDTNWFMWVAKSSRCVVTFVHGRINFIPAPGVSVSSNRGNSIVVLINYPPWLDGSDEPSEELWPRSPERFGFIHANMDC